MDATDKKKRSGIVIIIDKLDKVESNYMYRIEECNVQSKATQFILHTMVCRTD